MSVQGLKRYVDCYVYQDDEMNSAQLEKTIGPLEKVITDSGKLCQLSRIKCKFEDCEFDNIHTIRPISTHEFWITFRNAFNIFLLKSNGELINT